MVRKLLICFAMVTVFAFVGTAQAVNVLPNGGFEDDPNFAGWIQINGL
jgi:hypothetical protein